MHLAHGEGHVAVDVDGGVVVVVALPVLEGEAGVGGIGLIVADEVGQRPFLIDAEGLFAAGQGRLEQHGAMVVAVGTVEHGGGGGSGLVDAAAAVVVADLDQGLAPGILRGLDLGFGDVVVGDLGGAEEPLAASRTRTRPDCLVNSVLVSNFIRS